MAFGVQHLHQFLERSSSFDSAHVHTRGHDFAYRGFHEVEDVQNHLALFLLQTFTIGISLVREVSLRLHGVAAFFGQEAEFGIIAQALQDLDEQHMANLSRQRKRESNELEKRNQHNGKGIRLQVPEQVRQEHRNRVDCNAGNHQVSGKSEEPVFLHPVPRNHLEQIKTENARTHVTEDSANRDGLVKARQFHQRGDQLFAAFTVTGIALGIYSAKGGLDQRKRERGQDKNDKERNGPTFGSFHYAPSLYGSSPRNSHSRLRITLRSAALIWS